MENLKTVDDKDQFNVEGGLTLDGFHRKNGNDNEIKCIIGIALVGAAFVIGYVFL